MTIRIDGSCLLVRLEGDGCKKDNLIKWLKKLLLITDVQTFKHHILSSMGNVSVTVISILKKCDVLGDV